MFLSSEGFSGSLEGSSISSSFASSGDGLFSGSFSGSFEGDGSGLTGLATNLNFTGDDGATTLDLLTTTMSIAGTANEITTSVTANTVTIGLPNL